MCHDSSGLFKLPHELYASIMNHLDIREMKPLMESSSRLNQLTRSAFYNKIYINDDDERSSRTSDIVALFRRKPELLDLVYYLIIEELDEGGIRDLLALPMPSLRSIILRHKGPIFEQRSSQEKMRLNESLLVKQTVENCRSTYCYSLLRD
jgi:hypothetical protein